MHLEISKIDPSNEEQLLALERWWNDKELIELTTLMKESFVHTKESIETLQKQFQNQEQIDRFFMIKCNDDYVGYYSIMMDPEHLFVKEEGTSWLGFMIGERSYWGKGIGEESMKHFERESIRRGAKRIELGVFDYNDRAKSFYRKIGFKEIGTIPGFTFYNQQLWDGIRMEKILLLK